MNVRAGCLTCVLALLPVAAQAQTISGSIEGSGGAGSSMSNGQAQTNNSFWQGYSLGFSSLTKEHLVSAVAESNRYPQNMEARRVVTFKCSGQLRDKINKLQ